MAARRVCTFVELRYIKGDKAIETLLILSSRGFCFKLVDFLGCLPTAQLEF